MPLASLESHHPQDLCGAPSFVATDRLSLCKEKARGRSTLGLDASIMISPRRSTPDVAVYIKSRRKPEKGLLSPYEKPRKQKSTAEFEILEDIPILSGSRLHTVLGSLIFRSPPLARFKVLKYIQLLLIIRPRRNSGA